MNESKKKRVAGHGKIKKTPEGKIVCHICGESFHSLGRHVGHAHGLTAKLYKEQFGLSNRQPLCSKKVSEERKRLIAAHPELIDNLRDNSKSTQFQKNDGFVDKRRIQAEYSQKEKEYSIESMEAMIANGKRLGKSKSGNKARQEKRKKLNK